MIQDSNNKNHYTADPGNVFVRLSDGKIVGKELYLGYIYYKNGVLLEPSELDTIDNYTEQYLVDASKYYTFKETRELTAKRIKRYDSSEEVNSFVINGMKIWLDKATRVGLQLRFDSEKSIGKQETTLWFGEISFTIPIDIAVGMLQQLELYASECYDVTQKHLAAINKLGDITAIRNYDYKSGYPAKLEFTI